MSDAIARDVRSRRDISIFERLALSIRRRETPIYDWLYRFGKAVKHVEMPSWRPLFRFLYWEQRVRKTAFWNFVRVVYHEPMFKSRCDRVGRRLLLRDCGMPLILGHLRLVIGDGCVLSAVTTFAGSKVADDPVLEIGDGSHIGYQTVIFVGEKVSIGKNCMITNRCFIAGADGHPIDPVKRRTEAEPKSSLRSIIIEDDVMVATGSVVHKGVTIGRGSVVSAGSVVTKNVPPYTVVAGNPARVVFRIPRPQGEA